jgi:PAS domain S-box-containing protein
MSHRFKLVLPGVLILTAAVAVAIWPMLHRPASLPALVVLAAAAVLLAQWLAYERRLHDVRCGLRAALAGQPCPPVHAREWSDVVAEVASLKATSQGERQALEMAVSQSRRIEEALRASEERYVLAVKGAQDGLWECDLAGKRMLLSPRWRHMLGLDGSIDSVSLDEWQERLHPDDRGEAMDALDGHLVGRTERYEHVHRLSHAEGGYRWVLSRGTALRRASGLAYRVVGLDTDITKLKRVEAIIDAIAKGTAGQSGEPFFHALVQHFARALHIECAFITECMNCPPTRARTLAFWRRGNFDENFEYDLAGTPCDLVMHEGRTVFYPTGLAEMFPCEADHESYLGLPLFARDGVVIGHLAFLDRQPMSADVVIESVYRVFTARAAVEIELSRALQGLSKVDSSALSTP